MTNHIFLHGLKVKTIIGVPDWERKVVQELLIDIDIELNDCVTFDSDDLSKTIDYSKVELIVKDISKKNKHHLLESFGEKVISNLKDNFSFKSIRLKISKQKILPDTDFVGIILNR